MLAINGQIDVRCTIDEAWDLFCRFGDVAKMIPSVEKCEVDGDRVFGRVAIKLGILQVSSRVAIEVTERVERACLKAEGVSYLGETLHDQVSEKGVRGIDRGSSGRLRLQLDLEPTDDPDQIRLVYHGEVIAEGRLKRIYQSIIKNKAPAMIDEFADNVRARLEGGELAQAAADASEASAALAVRPPWWRRVLDWFIGIFSRRRSPA